MKALKGVLAVAVLAAFAVAAYQLCWLRYRCEVTKKTAERRLVRAFREGMRDAEREAIGRAMLDSIQPCLEHDPADYQTRIIAGMAAEAAGRRELALTMYESALPLNERPEIYSNIGVLQFELGRPEEAKQNLLRACIFEIAYSGKVSQPLAGELYAAVAQRQERLMKLAAERRR